MSLMHDALREMDKTRPESGSRQTPLTYDTTPSSPQKGPAVAMSTAADLRMPATAADTAAWSLAWILGGSLSLILAAFWWLQARSPTAETPSTVAIAAFAEQPKVSVIVPPKTFEAPPLRVSAADTAASSTPILPPVTMELSVPPLAAPVVAVTAPLPAKPTTNPATPKPSTTATEKPRATLITDEAQARSTAATRATIAATASSRFTAIANAIEAGDTGAATLQLSRLEQELPAGSLTLLRAQAWVLSVGGDMRAARAAYAAILARLPDDENALLNLASVELNDGKMDAAGALVASALRAAPDSSAARAAQQRIARATEVARAADLK